MALDFLEEIYEKALLIEYARETLEYLNRNQYTHALNYEWRNGFLKQLRCLEERGITKLPYDALMSTSELVGDRIGFGGGDRDNSASCSFCVYGGVKRN